MALKMAAGALIGANSAQQARPAAAHLMQGSGFHRSHSMRAVVSMSASIVNVAAVQKIPLYGGMGAVNFGVTTINAEAQRYFSQGVAFAYGFNRAAAIASFREAQRLDPECGMCWWGEAFHISDISSKVRF